MALPVDVRYPIVPNKSAQTPDSMSSDAMAPRQIPPTEISSLPFPRFSPLPSRNSSNPFVSTRTKNPTISRNRATGPTLFQSVFKNTNPTPVAKVLAPVLSDLESAFQTRLPSTSSSFTSPSSSSSYPTTSAKASSSLLTRTASTSLSTQTSSPAPDPPSSANQAPAGQPLPVSTTTSSPVPPPPTSQPQTGTPTSTKVGVSVGVAVPAAAAVVLFAAFYYARRYRNRRLGYQNPPTTTTTDTNSPNPTSLFSPRSTPKVGVPRTINAVASPDSGAGASLGTDAARRVSGLLFTARHSSQSLVRDLCRHNGPGDLAYDYSHIHESAATAPPQPPPPPPAAEMQQRPTTPPIARGSYQRSGLLWNLPYNPFAFGAPPAGYQPPPPPQQQQQHERSGSQTSVRSGAAREADKTSVDGFDFWCAGDPSGGGGQPGAASRETVRREGTVPSWTAVSEAETRRSNPPTTPLVHRDADVPRLLDVPGGVGSSWFLPRDRYSGSSYGRDHGYSSDEDEGGVGVHEEVDIGTMRGGLGIDREDVDTEYRPHPALSIIH